MANQGYNRAVELLQDGDYRTAIRDFDSFLASYPEDRRAGKARVLRALANVRQYVSVSGGTWSTALDAAARCSRTWRASPSSATSAVDLAELVIRIGEGLADRARHAADEKALREAESAVPLHAAIAGEPAPAFLKRSRLPGLLDEARAAVLEGAGSGPRRPGGMDLAIGERLGRRRLQGPRRAHRAVRRPGPGPRADQRMTQANDLVRRAVKVESTPRAAAATRGRTHSARPRAWCCGRPRRRRPPTGRLDRYALADGLAYGLDPATGAPLWQRPVGLAVSLRAPGRPGRARRPRRRCPP